MLLQLLDDGRLTDGKGRTVDFRNTLVIMTSNLGSNLWLDGQKVSREQVMQTLQGNFKPEFLTRIDEIIVFHSRGKEQLDQIVTIQLRRVEKLIEERGYHLDVTSSARVYLGEAGYDPDYGARPLKRAIQNELLDPLAIKLLNGKFHQGETIVVERGKDGLEFRSKGA